MLKSIIKSAVASVVNPIVATEARRSLLWSAKAGATLKIVAGILEVLGTTLLEGSVSTAEVLEGEEVDHRLHAVIEKVKAIKASSDDQEEFYREQVLPKAKVAHEDGKEMLEKFPQLRQAQLAYYNEGSLAIWPMLAKIIRDQIAEAQEAAQEPAWKKEIISHSVRVVDASELGALQEKLKRHLEENGVRFAPQPPRD